MNVTKSEASGALRDIAGAQLRTCEMRGYHRAAPYLILWGVIWALGYGSMAGAPTAHWGIAWLPLDLIGIAGSIAIGVRSRGRGGESADPRRTTTRSLFAGLFIAAFIGATFTIFSPVSIAPALVFPGLVVGLIYGAVGLLWMPRLAWVGGIVFVLSLAGFFFMQDWLALWMAAVGGGGLIVGGLWLRGA